MKIILLLVALDVLRGAEKETFIAGLTLTLYNVLLPAAVSLTVILNTVKGEARGGGFVVLLSFLQEKIRMIVAI